MKTIKLTPELLKREFDRLNRLYFRSKLKRIPIQLAPSLEFDAFLIFRGTKIKDTSGITWEFSNPQRIIVSSSRKFTKKELSETLCHEMIHQLMAQNNEREYGKDSHGENFGAYCHMIEAQSDLNVARR